MDYGGKLFNIENWKKLGKEQKKSLEKPSQSIKQIEDVNMMMFGFGKDADDYLKRFESRRKQVGT